MDGVEDKSQVWGPSIFRPDKPLEIAKMKGYADIVVLFKNGNLELEERRG